LIHAVPRAEQRIGKGGDKLIPTFLTAKEHKDHGEELEQWRGELSLSET
jgi:hypothetical protein